MYLSTQKKIQPPIKFEIIVLIITLKLKKDKHKYKIGVDNCHLIKYNINFFIFTPKIIGGSSGTWTPDLMLNRHPL